jgi:glycosyltransferase involved in cell wall biosynthesis
MAAALVTQGERVTLFSSSWKDRLSVDAVDGAATVDARIPVTLLNFAWHRLGWPPVEQLGSGGADVVWSMHPLLMPSRGAAQVVTVHDLYFLDHPENTSREIRRDYAKLASDHAQRADGVIAVSEYTRGKVIEWLGVPPDRITVCGSGAPQWDRREEPASAGPILHLGTIEPRKNVPGLIGAYAELVHENKAVPNLILAGAIEDAASLYASIGADLESRVEVRGYVTDAERLRVLKAASMVVVASSDEGFGLPALEAMTLGVPVVASRRGSLPEIVGDAGLLVDPDDRNAFASAMRRLLDDRALRRELADRGVARARAFSWEASAQNARNALAAAIERRKART